VENKKKYVVISLVILVAVIAIFGSYYAYGYYMNQKFEENFKLHYQAHTNENNYFQQGLAYDNQTVYSEQGFETRKNNTINSYNNALEYGNKDITYQQEMVKYSPDNVHKKYAEALLKVNQEAYKLQSLYLELTKLWVYPGEFSDDQKAKQILTDINTTSNNIETFNNEKDQIKLLNPELNKQIELLTNESETAIT